MAQDIVIRGQEVTVQLVVNGELKAGSFAKMESFSATPRTDLVDNSYLGDVLDTPDIQHHGWDFTFTMREQGGEVADLILQILNAEEASTAHPVINLVVTTLYRDVSAPSQTLVVQNAVMKADTAPDVSGRRDYVTSTWSGKAQKVRKL